MARLFGLFRHDSPEASRDLTASQQELEEYPSLDLLFSETRDMLIRQLDRIEALDTKAGLLLGFDALVITSVVGLLSELSGASSARWPPCGLLIVVCVVLLGLIAVVASFVFAVKGFGVQDYNDVVNPRTSFDKWKDWTQRQTKMQLRANLEESYELNEQRLKKKANAIQVALWLLLAGLLSFVLVTVAYAISIVY